jgi:solute carrier family 39 (zinc transporter), member 1/2/3
VTKRNKRENSGKVGVEGVEGASKVDEDLESHPIFTSTTKFEDTILLILALCFYSLFEGIAIGVSG